MQIWNAHLLHRAEMILGEGAIWHPVWQKFLYVDIEGMYAGVIDPLTRIIRKRTVDKRIGTIVPSINGNLIIALQGSIAELNFETGEIKQLIAIEPEKPKNRCNDGKCDAAGRLWIGTMHVDAKPEEGGLYYFEGTLHKKLDKKSIPNGICWSGDNRIMYHIDSFSHNIKAYDFDLLTGNISNESIAINDKDSGFVPDGMTIDAEGMLWVAMWGGSCVNRYDPNKGTLVGKVIVDAPNVTSCALGGEKMQQLFITTASAGLSSEELKQYPLSGSLFIADVGIKGSETHFFKKDLIGHQ